MIYNFKEDAYLETIYTSKGNFNKFTEMLIRPVQDNVNLLKLMSSVSPWEQSTIKKGK